jgi:hypothetical protein
MTIEDYLTRDPWSRVTSLNGVPADELISGLQKCIRRGLLEDALLIAREMYVSGPQLSAHLWTRLQIIAVEDTGDGLFAEPGVLESLFQIYSRIIPGEWSDRWVVVVHAVRYLVERPKDRTSSELAAVIADWHDKGRLADIPDAAIDIHTVRGRAQGRGMAHYMREGAAVANEWTDRNRNYFERWRALTASPTDRSSTDRSSTDRSSTAENSR